MDTRNLIVYVGELSLKACVALQTYELRCHVCEGKPYSYMYSDMYCWRTKADDHTDLSIHCI